jgi:hypothetical protein
VFLDLFFFIHDSSLGRFSLDGLFSTDPVPNKAQSWNRYSHAILLGSCILKPVIRHYGPQLPDQARN